MRKLFSLRGGLLAAVALIAFCLPSLAQGNIRTVLFVKVKLGQEGNWAAAVKDYAATFKKAGVEQGFTVWESESGPSQHAVVWYSAKWKEIDEQDPKLKPVEADVARLFERLDQVTESLETWIDEMQPDLTIRSMNIPAYVRVGRTKVISGKMDDVKAIFHDTIYPAIKKAGYTDYGVAMAKYGTPSNEFHTYIGLSGWDELDSPFGTEKGMSPAEYKAFQAKVTPLIESTEWSMWKYQPELSYVPAAK